MANKFCSPKYTSGFDVLCVDLILSRAGSTTSRRHHLDIRFPQGSHTSKRPQSSVLSPTLLKFTCMMHLTILQKSNFSPMIFIYSSFRPITRQIIHLLLQVIICTLKDFFYKQISRFFLYKGIFKSHDKEFNPDLKVIIYERLSENILKVLVSFLILP